MTLNGFDVSAFQAADVTSIVSNYDFAGVKATEGTGYVSTHCDTQVQGAFARGKRALVYHFADGGNADSEAAWFVKNITGYVGKAALALDWEGAVVAAGPGYAEAFCDAVYAATKVKPVIYMSDSVLRSYDWSRLAAKGYLAWRAAYPYPAATSFAPPAQPSVPWWGAPVLDQYSDNGHLDGVGPLDLDVFYGTESDWDALVKGNGLAAQHPAAQPVVSVVQPVGHNASRYSTKEIQAKLGITQDGIYGPATTAAVEAFQKSHGLTVDGIVGPNTAASLFGAPSPVPTETVLAVDGVWGTRTTQVLQKALGVHQDGVFGPATTRALQAHLGVHVDGIYGPQTKEALQRRLGVKADGIIGPATIRALQGALNAGRF